MYWQKVTVSSKYFSPHIVTHSIYQQALPTHTEQVDLLAPYLFQKAADLNIPTSGNTNAHLFSKGSVRTGTLLSKTSIHTRSNPINRKVFSQNYFLYYKVCHFTHTHTHTHTNA